MGDGGMDIESLISGMVLGIWIIVVALSTLQILPTPPPPVKLMKQTAPPLNSSELETDLEATVPE